MWSLQTNLWWSIISWQYGNLFLNIIWCYFTWTNWSLCECYIICVSIILRSGYDDRIFWDPQYEYVTIVYEFPNNKFTFTIRLFLIITKITTQCNNNNNNNKIWAYSPFPDIQFSVKYEFNSVYASICPNNYMCSVSAKQKRFKCNIKLHILGEVCSRFLCATTKTTTTPAKIYDKRSLCNEMKGK